MIFAYTLPSSQEEEDHVFVEVRIGLTNEIYQLRFKSKVRIELINENNQLRPSEDTSVSLSWSQIVVNQNISPGSFKIAEGNFTGDLSIARCWDYARQWTHVEMYKVDEDRNLQSVGVKMVETPVE